MIKDQPKTRSWALALLALAFAAMLLLLHPYRGLVHDSRLYAIEALSRVNPGLYGNDIFVSVGSQGDYTLFPALFSWAISWLGVEPAAAVLTACMMLLFLAATWLLARRLLSAEQAAIAMLLVIIAPAYYGPSRIFHYLEEFATPRQLAESLVLFGLLAWLSGRRVLSCVMAACSVLIHPIIGVTGIALIPAYEWIAPRWRRLLPAAGLGGAVFAMAALGWIPVSRWQFDAEWYGIVMNRTYLGLLNWNSEDWGRVTVALATLAVSGMALRDRLQRIAIAAFIVTCFLLLVALVGGDLLHIVLVVQAQTWRVLWLATLLAILMLPALFTRNWQSTPLARCALLLLGAAWLSSHPVLELISATLAVLAMALAARTLKQSHGRLCLSGGWMVLFIAVVHGLATAGLRWQEGLTQVESLPPLLDRLLTFNQGGMIPALLLLACGVLLKQYPYRATRVTLGAMASVGIAALAVPVASTWTWTRYEESMREAFRDWRALIPPSSNVMWAAEESPGGDGALNTWMLLERPSFISGAQAPNALFSRPAALEMRARTQQLWGRLPFTDPFRPKGSNVSSPQLPLQLATLCQASSVRYVVTQATMSDAIPVPAPASAPVFLRNYKLYICT